ncbi:MAG: hypothetical protein AB1540_06970 [Bdellovibrionota bacterium]
MKTKTLVLVWFGTLMAVGLNATFAEEVDKIPVPNTCRQEESSIACHGTQSGKPGDPCTCGGKPGTVGFHVDVLCKTENLAQPCTSYVTKHSAKKGDQCVCNPNGVPFFGAITELRTKIEYKSVATATEPAVQTTETSTAAELRDVKKVRSGSVRKNLKSEASDSISTSVRH